MGSLGSCFVPIPVNAPKLPKKNPKKSWITFVRLERGSPIRANPSPRLNNPEPSPDSGDPIVRIRKVGISLVAASVSFGLARNRTKREPMIRARIPEIPPRETV